MTRDIEEYSKQKNKIITEKVGEITKLYEKIEKMKCELEALHSQYESLSLTNEANYKRAEKAELSAGILWGALNDLRILYQDQSVAYTTLLAGIVDRKRLTSKWG